MSVHCPWCLYTVPNVCILSLMSVHCPRCLPTVLDVYSLILMFQFFLWCLQTVPGVCTLFLWHLTDSVVGACRGGHWLLQVCVHQQRGRAMWRPLHAGHHHCRPHPQKLPVRILWRHPLLQAQGHQRSAGVDRMGEGWGAMKWIDGEVYHREVQCECSTCSTASVWGSFVVVV